MDQSNTNTPKKEIKIADADFTYESFMALIEFLYTDFADGLTPQVAEKLLPIATRYLFTVFLTILFLSILFLTFVRYGLPRLEAICKVTIENTPHSKQIKWIPRSTLESDFSRMLNSKEYHDIKYANKKFHFYVKKAGWYLRVQFLGSRWVIAAKNCTRTRRCCTVATRTSDPCSTAAWLRPRNTRPFPWRSITWYVYRPLECLRLGHHHYHIYFFFKS